MNTCKNVGSTLKLNKFGDTEETIKYLNLENRPLFVPRICAEVDIIV